MPCSKGGFFWWIFLSLLFFLSSPAFLGKPSPHVDVRITLHLCLCEDKFMLLLLWVCPSSSSDVLLSFFPPYCCCPFTPVSFEHVQYGWGWMCSLLRNLSDLCFDYFFSHQRCPFIYCSLKTELDEVILTRAVLFLSLLSFPWCCPVCHPALRRWLLIC